MRSQIGQADIEKWVVDSVMAIVADKCAFFTLRVVILSGIEALIDKYHAAALQFGGQGLDKGILCRMQLACV